MVREGIIGLSRTYTIRPRPLSVVLPLCYQMERYSRTCLGYAWVSNNYCFCCMHHKLTDGE